MVSFKYGIKLKPVAIFSEDLKKLLFEISDLAYKLNMPRFSD